MTNASESMKQLIAAMSGQARTLTVQRAYIGMLGDDVLAALFLSQCIYWTDRAPKGWFAKSYDDWHDELGLTARQIRRIVIKLKAFGLHTAVRKSNYYSGAPTVHYKIDLDTLAAQLSRYLEETAAAKPAKTSQSQSLQNGTIEGDEKAQSLLHRVQAESTNTYAPSGDGGANEPPPARKPRKRDALFDMIAERSYNLPPGTAIGSAGGRIAKTVKAVRAMAVTPDELAAFYAWYARQYNASPPRDGDKLALHIAAYRATAAPAQTVSWDDLEAERERRRQELNAQLTAAWDAEDAL